MKREYVSPIDGHRHFGDLGRGDCAVCRLEAERDRLLAELAHAQTTAVVANNAADAAAEAVGAMAEKLTTLMAERDRLRAAVTLIAIPPSNAMRHDHEFIACTGCAHVAQRALDGHDYRPNVAALDGSAEATDG